MFLPLQGHNIWYRPKIDAVSWLAHLVSSPTTQVTRHPPNNYQCDPSAHAWMLHAQPVYPRSMRDRRGRQIPRAVFITAAAQAW